MGLLDRCTCDTFIGAAGRRGVTPIELQAVLYVLRKPVLAAAALRALCVPTGRVPPAFGAGAGANTTGRIPLSRAGVPLLHPATSVLIPGLSAPESTICA